MFKKILIANRGEIACRVIKTCRRLDIATVAVYSDADRDSLHVEMADEAVFLGPPPAAESYLKGDLIIQAAKDTGAEAIHPGFGFLSENAGFVEAVEAAGLVFIGPGTRAIDAMGDKIRSKQLAKEAGVSTVPGYIGEIADADEAIRIAGEIGYPVMIKASAGGGGKGMRIAHTEQEVADNFRAARSEAKSSFGDERIFIEKFVEQPRHIEIQVLADGHGTVLYLGERECSIQRRHQKVIEEAPSPFIDAETRKAMGEQAVALARAVDYRSAGTVEFIADKDRNFYFLEMNTRLQVEHPVTELITGIDLVEQMIRVAAGEKLALTQTDVKLDGWAMEARVYAEDPYRNFLPSIGRLKGYRPPEEGEQVRLDTGVGEGSEISLYYDPMIAKLVTHGPDRIAAIDAMVAALSRYHIRGITHNIPFLAAVMEHPRFRDGALTTNFIAEEYPDGFEGAPLTPERAFEFRAVALFIHALYEDRLLSIDGRVNRGKPVTERRFQVWLDDEAVEGRILPSDSGAMVSIGRDKAEIATDWLPGRPIFDCRIDDRPAAFDVTRTRKGYRLIARGIDRELVVQDPHVADLMVHVPMVADLDNQRFLLCPMPGLVVQIPVAEGDTVEAGQTLAVVEAMKMENVLRAERTATVKAVKAKPGDSLAVDEVILEFAED
ncbi:acetyl/propionyl-CoA carboxylase subunit alpha [Rhodothalassium salexigens]|uniref:acetyl-CoA carboxylase biotin carboxylase subunit n=1 Tax=Rhodothalassium salexigens TaxID=1086 RepID=UPI00191452FE|nr:acetyl/propionyl/methylcrotonyl-CoA carboxylase subunit alpha [Rhodothalassium salexigens]MBK5911210.1 acetyl/propionyl-CoA carboxylase subunit alpha [Rhodothalassium salexigens]MBK5919899.1 acetyl/propionyl-CoA carboxylase subunit alpha [Rhodothalassium salexigens]